MRLAVCASGKLGLRTLLAIADMDPEITCVFTDKRSEPIIDWADQSKLPVFVGKPREGRASEFIDKLNVDVLLAINYLFIIDQDLIGWPHQYAINVHGSLLPKYRGRTPHVWAIINNEGQTGITAHLIDAGCDTGPIVEQIVIPIEKDDTGGSLLKKFERTYPVLVEKLLNAIKHQTVNPIQQDESKATYFGKRTPADGEINWAWQKERIRNWVRAQADPYPGAFTWLGKEKMIIDKVIFDDFGFHSDTPNGTVLSIDPIRVKTPNGVIRIEKAREIPQELKIHQRLGPYENS